MRTELAPDASTTLLRAHARSRERGRGLASQDIAVILADGPFREAFGDPDTRDRVVHALDEWAPLGALTTDAGEILALAFQNAQIRGRTSAQNIDLLTAVINLKGDPIEPLTLLSGDAEDPYTYRMSILRRASLGG